MVLSCKGNIDPQITYILRIKIRFFRTFDSNNVIFCQLNKSFVGFQIKEVIVRHKRNNLRQFPCVR